MSWRLEGSSEYSTSQFSEITHQVFLYHRFLSLIDVCLWITLLSHSQSKHVGLVKKKIAIHERWKKIFIIMFFDDRRQKCESSVGLQSRLHDQDATGWQFLCYTLWSKAPSHRWKVTTSGFKLNPSIRSTVEISGKLLKWSAVCLQSRSDNP